MQNHVTKTYAKALYEVCRIESLTEIEVFLRKFLIFLSDNKILNDTLLSPIYSVAEKVEATRLILSNDKFTNIFEFDCNKVEKDLILNFILLIIEKRRISLLSQIVDEFSNIVRSVKKLVFLEVFTAYTIENEEKNIFIKKLQDKFESQLSIKWNIDKNIIGGVMVKIGDKVYDSSIRGVLNKFKSENIL